MTIAFVADRASANSNSGVTTVDLSLSGMTVDNWLIIRTAAENSGGGGTARTVTLSNQSGTPINTGTVLTYQQNNDPGAASAGITCNVLLAKITATSGTLRITYSGSVVQACVVEEWSGLDPTNPVVGTPVGANGTNSTNLASVQDASIALGNAAYGAIAIEGPASDVIVGDLDSTGGSWNVLTEVATSNVTATDNSTTIGAYKIPSAAGAQQYNPTVTATARDSAGLILELASASTSTTARVAYVEFEIPVADTSTTTAQVAFVELEVPAAAPILPEYWMKIWPSAVPKPVKIFGNVQKPILTPAATPSGTLRWSPPVMDGDAVTFNVSGGSGGSTIYNAAGKDAYVNITGVITSRLIIRSAKNVRLIGGEINISTAWGNSNERWGLYFQDCSGIIHVEGLYIHGSQLIEGIDLGQITPGQLTSPYPDVLQIQNCRIVQVADPSGTFHADAIQCWGGVDALRIDMCTFESQYQNLIFKTEANMGGTADIQRLDMRGYNTQQEIYIKTAIGGLNPNSQPWWTGPITFGGDATPEKRVYATAPISSAGGQDYGSSNWGRVTSPSSDYSGGNPLVAVGERPTIVDAGGGVYYMHWPTSGEDNNPQIVGRIYKGPRPEGDYCPLGIPGMAYVSPGYA